MEIGPILRALFYNKSRFWLIAVEIALTLAVVVNCLNMIYDLRGKLDRPSGIDEENVLVIVSKPFAPEFKKIDYARASYREDLRMLRALPGVRAASSMSGVPLSGSGSSSSRRIPGTETLYWVPIFWADEGAIDSLGVELLAGRDFVAEDFPPVQDEEEEDEEPDEAEPLVRNVLISQGLADRMFPDGDALGARIENSDSTVIDTIVGIVEMHGPWPMSRAYDRAMLVPNEPWSRRRARFFAHAEPGMVNSLHATIEKELLALNEGRILTVKTLGEIERESFADLLAVNKLLGSVSFLLVAVTCLGVIGLTSFSVTQRTRQIGTRRALGATRLAILRLFLVENWILTGIGLALGLVFTYGLNYVLAEVANVAMLSIPLLVGCMALIWLVGLLAALAPALRGATVPPVVATRTV